ncbi:DUF2291 domain-containing protein [Ilyomonas limi]|uniref:DUF2291 domain-containing protein n=2 Tax=Ilyomonas limi TaxID=2575867 RepID=A0A4U3KWS5_9BACT|nr:DUF2291 domain-containing protein [Ilyomonas limi]
MNKWIRYGLLVLVIALLGYNSIYIKKLSDIKQDTSGKFGVKAFVQKLWKEKLPAKLQTAVTIDTLQTAIQSNPATAFEKYTHALALGNYRYALIKTIAIVNAVNEDNVAITLSAATPVKATLVTEFVYGNALRDASGLISLKDFPNTTDLNSISEELNKIIRQQVVPSFKSSLQPGNKIECIGAVQLNKEHIHFNDLEIIPVSVKVIS